MDVIIKIFLLFVCISVGLDSTLISKSKSIISSSAFSGWIPERAIDGIIHDFADGCDCCAGTIASNSSWFELDLGDGYIIYQIVVEGRRDHKPDQHFQGMNIYFNSVPDGFILPETSILDATFFVNYTLPTLKFTRFISLVLLNEVRRFTICELSVYGVLPDSQLISRNKVITSSSNQARWEKEKAIDGVSSPNVEACHCCAATYHDFNAWYQLDLGKDYIIDRIIVEGRQDHLYGQHYQGMNIYLHSVHDGFSNEETFITNATFYVNYKLPIPKAARFVSLVIVNITRVFTICELKVYRGCFEGYYGRDCERECGRCQDNMTCNHLTGWCENGCAEDSQTRMCNPICQYGTYGLNCKEACGHCGNNETCLFTDGTCPSGCASGYQGDRCIEECVDGTYGEHCLSTCGHCSDGQLCNPQTGHCKNGCEPGYLGLWCNQNASSSSSSIPYIWIVVGVGVIVLVVVVIIIMVLRNRRRSEKPKDPVCSPIAENKNNEKKDDTMGGAKTYKKGSDRSTGTVKQTIDKKKKNEKKDDKTCEKGSDDYYTGTVKPTIDENINNETKDDPENGGANTNKKAGSEGQTDHVYSTIAENTNNETKDDPENGGANTNKKAGSEGQTDHVYSTIAENTNNEKKDDTMGGAKTYKKGSDRSTGTVKQTIDKKKKNEKKDDKTCEKGSDDYYTGTVKPTIDENINNETKDDPENGGANTNKKAGSEGQTDHVYSTIAENTNNETKDDPENGGANTNKKAGSEGQTDHVYSTIAENTNNERKDEPMNFRDNNAGSEDSVSPVITTTQM